MAEEKKTEDDFGIYVNHMKENIGKIKYQFQKCFDDNQFFEYSTLKLKIFAPEKLEREATINLPAQEDDFKNSYEKLQKYVYYHYLNEAPRIIIGNTVVYKTQVDMETILRNHVNDNDDFLNDFDIIVNQKGEYIKVDGARWDGIKIHPKKSRKNHKSKNKSKNKSNNKSRRQRRKM